MDTIEHPDIAMALATGYPHPVREHYVSCCDCDKHLSDEDTVYIWDGDYICDQCLFERVQEQIDAQTIAESLGIAWKRAYLLEEEE